MEILFACDWSSIWQGDSPVTAGKKISNLNIAVLGIFRLTVLIYVITLRLDGIS